jgi:hypothetical protein
MPPRARVVNNIGMAGRRTRLTAQVQHDITTALRAGNTRRAAVSYAGVGETTFYTWLERNQEFRAAVEKSEADAQVRTVALIQREAESAWQAAAWWLERRFPEDFGLRQHVDASVKLDLPALMRQAFKLRRDSALDPPDIE